MKLVVIGTSSSSGKSTIATVLCYLFRKRGLRVAPFKAQNMSLNSTSTWYGEEIAYIQYVQSLAASYTAVAHVNPVLLKPVSANLCEVIVLGRARWLVTGAEYMTRIRQLLWDVADTSLNILSRTTDVVVVEGAGAGFEPNLFEHDLANKLPLLHRDAHCIIIADIYRGGAFTSALGLYLSLPEKLREKVVGFLVNKLCGDEHLVEDAVKWLESKTGKRVLGVLPLSEELNIFPEDSLDAYSLERSAGGKIDVAVLWYPGLSSFGELHLLRLHPDVDVRLIRKASELGEPDLVVLPGTRDVFSALNHIRKSGLAEKLFRIAGSVPIVGVGEGFQILCREIVDTHGLESGQPQTVQGLSLVPARVVYRREKIVARVRAKLVDSGHEVVGFEIHRGVPVLERGDHLFLIVEKNRCTCSTYEGYQDEKSQIYGTMLHEVLSRSPFLNHVLRGIGRSIGDVELEELLLSRLERALCIFSRYVDIEILLDLAGG